MSARPPSVPPLLDGYDYLDVLGSGGFADVFRYAQVRPRRDVAVKVLLRGVGEGAKGRFESEANLMAMLSNHPSIVSIHAAGVADDGRPYLVMENCQPSHLGVRIRRRPLSVGRTLEIGIQVAGAVETAHRLGILHRDIKPANILFTEFGRPALTDFGISVADGDRGAAAFSVTWAPPEQIEHRAMGPSGDVYSLAATVWAMLVGRSPFDTPGDNNALAVATRVKTMPVPVTGRPDVPESLERALRTAMAKQPEQRYQSALEFARALQAIQAELHESVTTIDVREERGHDDDVDRTESGTRVTGFAFIDPDQARTDPESFDVSDHGTRQTGDSHGFTDPRSPFAPATTHDARATAPAAPAAATPTAPPVTASGGGQASVLLHGRGSRPASAPLDFTGPDIPQVPGEDTALAASVATATPDAAPRRRRPLLPIIGGVAASLVVGALALAWGVGGLGPATTGGPTATATKPADPIGVVIAPPAEGRAVTQGDQVVFTWRNPDPKAGDTFLYQPILVDATLPLTSTADPTATVPAQKPKTCLEVRVVRSNGQASNPTKVCTP